MCSCMNTQTQDSYYPDFFLDQACSARAEAGGETRHSAVPAWPVRPHFQLSTQTSGEVFSQISFSSVLHTFVPTQLKLLVA